jgi:chromosome segregation ATPase
MCKKLGIAVLAVVAGMFILKSTHLGMYAKTAFRNAKASLKQEISPEFMLQTAREEAAQLLPDLRKQISQVAAKDTEVKNLREEVVMIETNLDKQKVRIKAMKEELQTGKATVTWNERPYSSKLLSDRLSRELTASQRVAKELEAKKKLLDAEERSLDAARETLANWQSVKEQIDLEIARLENEVQTLKLAQNRSNFQLDDSRLSKIKGMLNEVRDRVRTGQTELKLLSEYDPEAVPNHQKPKSTSQLIKEVDDFLGTDIRDEKAAKR